MNISTYGHALVILVRQRFAIKMPFTIEITMIIIKIPV